MRLILYDFVKIPQSFFFQKNDSSLYKGACVGQGQGLCLRLCVITGLSSFVLQKIIRVRIPCCLINKKTKGTANAIPFILWRRARDSAHFVRRKVCYANYPDYRLLLTRLRLAKDCKGSNPTNNSQKNNGTVLHTIPLFMAESKGFFGVLPYAFASLRSLTTDFQTVHRTVFIGKADRPCSNPLLPYQQKNKGYSKRYTLYSWRRARDSNPRNRFGGLHDFQSCSFDQLGQLSVLPVILYTIV